MQQRVVVVELPSPYKTAPCWRCNTSIKNLTPSCPSCQALQPLPTSGLNYYSVFDSEPTLKINDEQLRSKFYALSKRVHPDRFSNVPPPEKEYSAQWSAYTNKAYQTLREEKSRAEYLLELFQIPAQKTTKVPTDLAETYFTLQELLMEPEGRKRLQAFRGQLGALLDEQEKEMARLGEVWEKTQAKEPFLLHLQEHLNKQKYLLSMIADLERKLVQSGDRWH